MCAAGALRGVPASTTSTRRRACQYRRRRQSCGAATYHNDIEFAHVIELADSV